MNVVINEWDDNTSYYKLWNVQKLNDELSKHRNCYGTVILATSKVQYG